MSRHAEGKIMYFSRAATNEVVRRHVREGGRAAVIEQGVHGEMLTIYDGDRHIPLIWTHLIPATFEGKAKFNVENALAAAAVAYALGASLEHIRQGLRTFTTSFFQAPGRCNVFDEHPFRVIVDYGHNAAAMEKMTELVQSLPASERARSACSWPPATGATTTSARVGADRGPRLRRRSWSRRTTTSAAAPAGEVAGLLREGAIEGGVDPARVHRAPATRPPRSPSRWATRRRAISS